MPSPARSIRQSAAGGKQFWRRAPNLEPTAGQQKIAQAAAAQPAWALLLAALLISSLAAGCNHIRPAASTKGEVIRPSDSFYSVAFLPSGKCYVVGSQGILLGSSDLGRAWRRRNIAERGDLSWLDLYSIRFAADGEHGWISGESGLILQTHDGGQTWNRQSSGTTENLFRLGVVDAEVAFATGTNGVLMRTVDGGARWQAQTLKSQLTMFDIAFSDVRNGWAVGEFQTIIHTADAGETWAAQMGGKRANFRLPALFAVSFTSALQGWVAGQGGSLFRTDDGGKTWQTVAAPTSAPMYGLAYSGANTARRTLELWG